MKFSHIGIKDERRNRILAELVPLHVSIFFSVGFDKEQRAESYNKRVAALCLKQTVEFLNQNDDSVDEETQAQIIVLKYLLFRFLNNDLRTYISIKE